MFHYRIRQLAIRFLCVFLILSVSLLADKPWLTKSARDWDTEDVEQILSASPWVREEAVRIVPSEGRTYRESFFGLFGKEDLYWVRFTWLAEPIHKACELIDNLPIVLQTDSRVFEFLTAYRALESWQGFSGQEPLLAGKNILVLLQGDILSGLIGPHNWQEVQTAFLSTETGEQIEASNLLFGLSHPAYDWGEKGVERALVEVEDLQRADLRRQPQADQTPLSTIVYVPDLHNAHDVRCVVLIFPREGLGDENVTVVVPTGGKTGLTAKFRLAEMLVAGKQKF